MRAISVDTWRTIDTPAGNPAYWVMVSGPTSDYGKAGRLAGIAARKIAQSISPVTHAHRITSDTTWDGPNKVFQERVLYAFDNGEIN